MNKYKQWLNNLKKCWEEKDFNLLSSILIANVEWHESPFGRPFETKESVVEQWKKDLADQKDIHFDYEILLETPDACVANWSASFDNNDKHFDMDGVFYFELDTEDRCKLCRQWWVVK
jgi:hypothetical protein